MSGLLLDTHTWYWFAIGSDELSPKTRRLINEQAKLGQLSVAAISLWEIAMLEAKKRIALGSPCGLWIDRALNEAPITLVPLSPSIAVESCQMAQEFHGDPADRMIVATARTESLRLATRDKRILAFAKKHHSLLVVEV